MIRYSFLVGIVFSSITVFAQPNSGGSVTDDDLQLNTITTALPFMNITPDSRAGGMGDAGTALSPNASSIFWNTAMLNFAKDKTELGISYTPWLRNLTNDIHLSYLSGYTKINKRMAVAGSFRYFNLGEITFTTGDNQFIRDFKPSELELAGGYSFLLNERNSIGLNGKFASSNLTAGIPVSGQETKAARTGATDISYAYHNEDIRWFKQKAHYSFGATINNVGAKVAYSETERRDFIPMNLKIGNAYTAILDGYNSLTVSVDLQRLLVPTPPILRGTGQNQLIVAGKNDNVGIISGLFQSFGDAPGTIAKDKDGNEIIENGVATIVKGSKLKEELREINIGTGVEYNYNNVLAFRGGFYYESKTKGARQFFNIGASFQYNVFGIDFSYLASLQRNNPLANTLRFSLRFKLGAKEDNAEAKPE
jgi:hypothetical protein